MVLCPVVSLWMFENLVKYEKKNKQTKKNYEKPQTIFFKYSPFSESLSTLDKSFDYSE